MTFNLQLPFFKAITLWSERLAIADGDKHFTYSQFGQRVKSLIQCLLGNGIDKGAHVAIIAPNCHQYMEVYFATALLGVVLVPLNFRLQTKEICAILEDSQSIAIFVHPDFSVIAIDSLPKLPAIRHVFYLGREAATDSSALQLKESISSSASLTGPCEFQHYEQALAISAEKNPEPTKIISRDVESDDLAQIYYTSGTTGKPKGVMLTHMNVCSNALGCVSEFQFNETTVWGHFAPIFHLADAWSLFAITWSGGKHVFIPYFKVDNALNAIATEGVTHTVLVPTMVNQILAAPQRDSYDLSSLKLLTTAGSPIAPAQVIRIIEELKCDYLQFYGLTETSPFLTIGLIKEHLLSLPSDKLIELKSRTGRPFISMNVKVVDESGNEIQHDNEAVGEIVASGPNVMKGYWRQPDSTALAIVDGWFHTGDLACVDSEGYINIVDRKKDMIITGGENVFSTEVEYALYSHKAVHECAVFGIPDEKWGEVVAAVIVLKAGETVSEDELKAHVKSCLASYKTPRKIEYVSELPKTGSGKIYKRLLREKYWNDSGRQIN